jgi:hypothetical protein
MYRLPFFPRDPTYLIPFFSRDSIYRIQNLHKISRTQFTLAPFFRAVRFLFADKLREKYKRVRNSLKMVRARVVNSATERESCGYGGGGESFPPSLIWTHMRDTILRSIYTLQLVWSETETHLRPFVVRFLIFSIRFTVRFGIRYVKKNVFTLQSSRSSGRDLFELRNRQCIITCTSERASVYFKVIVSGCCSSGNVFDTI